MILRSLHIVIVLILVLAATSCHSSQQTTTVPTYSNPDVSRTLIIYYDSEAGRAALLKAAKSKRCKIIYSYQIFNAIALKIPDGTDKNDTICFFKKINGVISVTEDRSNILLNQER